MSSVYVAEMTWVGFAERLKSPRHVVILPLGTCEAHGPHCLLSTDAVIAEAMIDRSLEALQREQVVCLVMPTVNYGVTLSALGFSGTISIEEDVLEALIVQIGAGLERTGARRMFIVNHHFEPEQVQTIYRAMGRLSSATFSVGYFDLTRKSRAIMLGEEFRSGDCHAGAYETSIVMARRPGLIDESKRRELPRLSVQLVKRLSEGLRDFREVGMASAYCGAPAEASASDGEAVLSILGGMLAEAIEGFVQSGEADSPGAYTAF